MKIADYRSIRQLATAHILKGGGVLPSDAEHGFDPITAIAVTMFGAGKADQNFDRSIGGLERTRHAAIYTAAWDLVCAYQDAAFAFGAAVGL